MVVGVQLEKLTRDVKDSRQAAFSLGTNRNLLVQFKTFVIFCIYFHLVPVPVSLADLSMYVQFLSRSFKTVTAVKNYVHGVRILHLGIGATFPELDFSFKMLLRGLSRLKPHETVKALPVTTEVLLSLFSVMDMSTSLHRALWSGFLLAFFLFARKSNVVPPSDQAFDLRMHLARGDIRRSTSGLVVLLKWSKTIQFGERHVLVPVLEIPGSVLCPRRAFDQMVDRLPSTLESPAFLFVDGRGVVKSLTHGLFVDSLRGLLVKAGVNSKGFSGHSFRRGGASCAFRAGVPGELVQLHGDWRSDAYLSYLSIPVQHRLQVTHRMRSYILSLHTVGEEEADRLVSLRPC